MLAVALIGLVIAVLIPREPGDAATRVRPGSAADDDVPAVR